MRASSGDETQVISHALVTERVLLSALREHDAAALSQLARQRAEFLAEASLRFGKSLDEELTYAAMAGITLPGLDAWCVVDVIEVGGALRRLAVVHPDPDKQDIARVLSDEWLPRIDDPIGIPAVRRAGRRMLVTDVHDVLARAASDAHTLKLLWELGVGALLVVPISGQGELLGALTFVGRSAGVAYSEHDIKFAESLAARCAQALESARSYATARAALIEAAAAFHEAERAREEAEVARADAELARMDAVAARAVAESANAAKAHFLSTMSHELRTPLNAIGGYAQLLEMGIRGPVTPEQQSDLASIQRNQAHLLGLVESVLQFAQVQAGHLLFAPSEVSIGELVTGLEGFVSPQMRAKDLHYECDVCDSDIRVFADPGKVRQIVLNLLVNAAKFTPRGGIITVSCARAAEATESAGAMVAVSVSDTGPGIPNEDLQRIFDPFVQIDRKLSTTVEGVGLGLAISRELARGMGGELTVRSDTGEGCTFTLTLPMV